jgi:predicted enzyme related to lactoylglutathione lyase
MRRSLIKTLLLAAAVLTLAGGCTKAPAPPWPAITEPSTGIHTPGRWVWAELFADNVDAAKTFYREVFGWKYESTGAGKDAYTLVRADGRPIAGIVHFAKPADAVRSGRWLAFMSVPDVARAASRTNDAGGKVIVAPRVIPGRGEVAVLADPEGALFGVIRSAAGDPTDTFPAENAWLWLELWSKDTSRMADFYVPIGDYTVSRQEAAGDMTELYLVAGGYPRAAVLELKRTDLPSTWLPYVRVMDLKQTLANVTRAGGRVVVEPAPNIRNGKVAVFVDPLGAAVAVVEWKDESEEEGKP